LGWQFASHDEEILECDDRMRLTFAEHLREVRRNKAREAMVELIAIHGCLYFVDEQRLNDLPEALARSGSDASFGEREHICHPARDEIARCSVEQPLTIPRARINLIGLRNT
jgi:hypothetical protein